MRARTSLWPPAGRLTQDATSGPNAHTYDYTYDSVDNRLTSNEGGSVMSCTYDPTGNRTTMQDLTGTTTYAFDDAGRMIGKTDPGALSQRYAYDASGNRTTLVDPDGGIYTSTFNELNLTTRLQSPNGKAVTVAYDNDSRRSTLTFHGGAARSYAYDSANRLTTQIDRNSAGNIVMTMIDSYDGIGSRTRRDRNGNVTSWTYDDAARLLGQQGANEYATFSYDANGNTLSKWHQGTNPLTMTYDAANRITSSTQTGVAAIAYTHDKNGNVTNENSGVNPTEYAYTPDNRLKEIITENGTITNIYDGDGLRRVNDQDFGNRTTFVWDGMDYLQERKDSGVLVAYTNLGSEVIAQERSGTTNILVPDPLGSVAALMSDSGTITDTFFNWPYGEQRLRTGSTALSLRWLGTLGYYRDSGTLFQVRERELNALLTRWMTVVRNEEWSSGEHPYSYVLSSPASLSDPMGLWPTFVNCPPHFVDKVNNLCLSIYLMSSNTQFHINQCIASAAKKIGINCRGITKNRLACMSKWCDTDGVLVCGPIPIQPGGIEVVGMCRGATRYDQDLDSPKGTILVDVDNPLAGSYAREYLGSGGQLIFLHELMHACGQQHNEKKNSSGQPDTSRECNDIQACCILEVINKGNGLRCVKYV